MMRRAVAQRCRARESLRAGPASVLVGYVCGAAQTRNAGMCAVPRLRDLAAMPDGRAAAACEPEVIGAHEPCR
jgi:hypothetical protein